ncbi:uncharacterized protein NPIL_131201 [Nephila pilipes]|uniref:Uncharacterized protein n=1 Tax=Nephila pilipes TaxID=299642 RepID=A0A8X6PRW8_NEPPI|nr:uncharacterized protein NPIL_131201 [Nephila pilipes]
MAYYYKISSDDNESVFPSDGIEAYEGNSSGFTGPCIKYDFSKHVLIELLDNVTPEAKLWSELRLSQNRNIIHKRMIVDPHRVNCRRAIVVCDTAAEAKELSQRLSQTKIRKRTICAVVIQELLSDVCLFEKQIRQYGDKRSQHQFLYVSDLTRCREPSGLAQYLRGKFSPFGTILSIFVSEDKDGYAHPEGVIKFAHLSEAFAAELAYDQCAVAMERLSVTTHHNILLSQCDLRARLREAHLRQSSEFNPRFSSESQTLDNESNFHDTVMLPDNSSKANDVTKNDIQGPDESSSVLEKIPLSDSAEIADALKNPCESNFVDCLQSITKCNETSFSKTISGNSVSFSESELNSIDKSAIYDSSISPKSVKNKTWSSRILGWITDLPNNDASERSVVGNGTNQNHNVFSTANSEDVVSDTSFVTCKNADFISSCHSSPSLEDINHINDETLLADKTFSNESVCNPSCSFDEEKSDATIEQESTLLLNKKESENFAVKSLKRKNSSILTQKLSLKSKKMNYSQSDFDLDAETTVELSPAHDTFQCSVLLSSVPELDEFARNLSPKKSPIVFLEKLSASQIEAATSKTDDQSFANSEKIFNNSHQEGENIPDSFDRMSSKSLPTKSRPIRRSKRMVSQESDKRSWDLSRPPLKKDVTTKKLSAASINLCDKKDHLSKLEEEGDKSVLRAWLKKELIASTNNQVTKCQESTKSIVCATANKDVLISG